jgi:16S rRNA (uracil1498-N3)-methyltransferase
LNAQYPLDFLFLEKFIMHISYTPDISSDHYMLSEEESKHCIKVLRLKKGDQINLIDGRGGFYLAEIIDDHHKKTLVKVVEKIIQVKRSYKLHIAIAPTKNVDRLEWFLEKATEIGIDEVSFIECQYSERAVVKTERLNKIVTAAIKQSQQAYHPLLNEPLKFKEYLRNFKSNESDKYIAHCRNSKKHKFSRIYKSGKDVIVLIGPEGDFSEEEVKLAEEAGFKSISLGENRLRTETAALVACHTVSLFNEI